MRKSLFVIAIFSLLTACQSALILNEVQTENISNSPLESGNNIEIENLIAPYKISLEEKMSQVIGKSTEAMYKQKPESSLTNYLADLLLEEAVSYCKRNAPMFNPQIAYVNYGGIRSSIPQGDVTLGNIYELMPFENELVVLELDGDDLRAFAEYVVGRGGDGVAGVSIGIKDNALSQFLIEGKEPISGNSYFLVTNDYVASGGDGMSMFANPKKIKNTELKIRDLIIKNMRNNHQLGIEIGSAKDGRIYYEE